MKMSRLYKEFQILGIKRIQVRACLPEFRIKLIFGCPATYVSRLYTVASFLEPD